MPGTSQGKGFMKVYSHATAPRRVMCASNHKPLSASQPPPASVLFDEPIGAGVSLLPHATKHLHVCLSRRTHKFDVAAAETTWNSLPALLPPISGAVPLLRTEAGQPRATTALSPLPHITRTNNPCSTPPFSPCHPPVPC